VKISSLYRGRYKVPYVTFILALSCLWVSGATFFDNSLFYLYAYQTPPQHFWQALTGAFEHGSVMGGSVISQNLPPHLMLNLLMILPLGWMIECAIGSPNFAFVFANTWFFSSFLLQMLLWGSPFPITGASAISYALGPIAFYMVWSVFRINKTGFFRQPAAWGLMLIFAGMLFWLNPFITGWTSFFMHLFGLVMGVICLILFKTSIRIALARYRAGLHPGLKAPLGVQLFWLLPAALAALAVAHWAGIVTI
jgi:membrane associated rhomboid family serine protease